MRNYNLEQRPLDRTPQIPLDRFGDRTVRFPHTEQMPASSNFLLRSLPFSSLRRLQPHIKKLSLTAGEFISRPDEPVEWIYFPETTALSELQILEDGRTIEASITGYESAVGLATLFWPGRGANWVQASVPGNVVKVKRDELQRAVAETERISGIFHQAIQAYIKQLSQKVACNAHHSVEERFSVWLLMLQDRCHANRLKLTQEQIARVLGVYRPSVTCIAQSLRDAGLIDYVRGNIVIVDRDALRERGCGCYSEPVTDSNLLRFDEKVRAM
jgi:CRP-like cAMP-binding protein